MSQTIDQTAQELTDTIVNAVQEGAGFKINFKEGTKVVMKAFFSRAIRLHTEPLKTQLASGGKRLVILNLEEIKDLAECAGFKIKPSSVPKGEDWETEIVIADCPKAGVKGDQGEVQHYPHVAYFHDYPEEGVCPLGKLVTPTEEKEQKTPVKG